MKIKIATQNNIDDICMLYQELFSDMAILQPTFFQSAHQNKLFVQNIIMSPNSDILIAVDHHETLVGFALIQELETPPFNCFVNHHYAYLMDIIIASTHRNKGIGSSLINEVKTWAQSRNLDYIELNVLTKNVSAIKLYEKHKFKNVIQTMRYTL
ncbi:GNAT family N-acetyltransferase [Inediibacterium massiliense]|uniref:GNAT family N-acetyltransferase n=1 Tax=Inediibacterium massiliense TaxID=1658111 RepID=UPI0006B6269F|nr:GNAT family N-acetyltransferase [Inediibacterium massiliense]